MTFSRIRTPHFAVALLFLTGVLSGAVTTATLAEDSSEVAVESDLVEAGVDNPDDSLSEDPFAEDELTEKEVKTNDPLEPVNRGIFWFNEQVDYIFLEPVAKLYDKVLPDVVQEGVTNFFLNLEYPILLLADLVEFNFSQAGHDTARFAINTTVGVAGVMDMAEDFGLERESNDLGLALGRHGVPSGPYLVLPFMGPSNLRDLFGRMGDSAVHPFAILEYADLRAGIKDRIVIPGRILEGVQLRANLIDVIDAGRESAVDFYLFQQSAFEQYRNARIQRTGQKLDDQDKDFDN